MHRVTLALLFFIAGCATPIESDETVRDRTKAKQVAASMYVISAETSPYTTPAALKPLILRRARQIASQEGYKEFRIERISILYSNSSNWYTASAGVILGASANVSSPGQQYSTASSPDEEYRDHITPSYAASLAKVRSFAGRTDSALQVTIRPVFVDALGAEYSKWDGATAAYLRPGTQKIGVYIWIKPSLLADPKTLFLLFDAVLESGVSYTLLGDFKDGYFSYWLQDDRTGKPATEVRRVLVKSQ